MRITALNRMGLKKGPERGGDGGFKNEEVLSRKEGYDVHFSPRLFIAKWPDSTNYVHTT